MDYTEDLHEFTKDEIMSYLNHISKLGKTMKGEKGCHPSEMEMNKMQGRWNDTKFVRMKNKIWEVLNSIDKIERKEKGEQCDFDTPQGLKV